MKTTILWEDWFKILMELANSHGIITSDDADLWWDDFCLGKDPHESMNGYLNSLRD